MQSCNGVSGNRVEAWPVFFFFFHSLQASTPRIIVQQSAPEVIEKYFLTTVRRTQYILELDSSCLRQFAQTALKIARTGGALRDEFMGTRTVRSDSFQIVSLILL